jgi:hypothetical protein
MQSSTTQTMDVYGNQLQAVSNNYSGYSPSARTSTYTYLNSSNYTSRYIYNRLSLSPLPTRPANGKPSPPTPTATWSR